MELIIETLTDEVGQVVAGKSVSKIPDIQNQAQRYLNTLIVHGANLDGKTTLTRKQEKLIFNSPLERACHQHLTDPHYEVAIDTLLNLGADWRGILERPNADRSIEDVLRTFPTVKRVLLGEHVHTLEREPARGKPKL